MTICHLLRCPHRRSVGITRAMALAAVLTGAVGGTTVAHGEATPPPTPLDRYGVSGWIAVAKSSSKESLDWAGGPGRAQYDTETEALQNCAQLQWASDCIVLASGPNCVAVAWDAAEPLNRAYGAVGDTHAAALNAAVAAAGAFSNDPEVRCSYATYSPGAH
jgi:hypothetical protein